MHVGFELCRYHSLRLGFASDLVCGMYVHVHTSVPFFPQNSLNFVVVLPLTYTYIHTYIHIYIHIYIHTYIHTYATIQYINKGKSG